MLGGWSCWICRLRSCGLVVRGQGCKGGELEKVGEAKRVEMVDIEGGEEGSEDEEERRRRREQGSLSRL